MREELRIVPMTKTEYDEAMKKYATEEDMANGIFWDYLMTEFDEAYSSAMEINVSGVVYMAVLIDDYGQSIDDRLYELPEGFKNDLPDMWEV